MLKAEPDGHTLVMGSIALTLKPALYKTLRFDPRTEVTSVARLANQPMIIVSKPDLPVNNLADFIQLAKANPGKLSFGTPGPGTPQHFGAEMLCAQTGLKMIHVPYRGAVPAMTDIMSGQIDLYYATETSGGAHIAAGRMKPLAVTGEQRIATFPDVKDDRRIRPAESHDRHLVRTVWSAENAGERPRASRYRTEDACRKPRTIALGSRNSLYRIR